MHTTASDGMLEVPEVLDRARRAGLRAISITDHDTLSVHLQGSLSDGSLEVIPGLELSCDTDWGELHVLGYYVDVKNVILCERLEALRQNRIRRLDRIVDALARFGVKLEEQFVSDLRRRPGSVGRPHVARELLRMGVVKHFQEAFNRFLGQSGCAYVPHQNGLTPEDSIQLISQAGGVSVAAHPGWMLDKAPEEFLVSLSRAGLSGLETQHPSHSWEQVKECHRRAEQLGLIETGGSDFHSDEDKSASSRSANRHSAIGGSTVGYQVVLQIRELRDRGGACASLPS